MGGFEAMALGFMAGAGLGLCVWKRKLDEADELIRHYRDLVRMRAKERL